MKRTVWIAAVLVALSTQPAWAARTQVHEAAESPQYGRKFGGMIGRGLLNATTCFVDLIVNTVNETKNGPPLVGTLTGVAKGTGCGILRLGSGAVDLVTFWVPGFNGFPVSDSYENCTAVSQPSMSASMQSYESVQPVNPPAQAWQEPAPGSVESMGTSPAPVAPKPAVKKVWKK